MNVLTLGCLARVKAMVSTKSLMPRGTGGIQLNGEGGQLDISHHLAEGLPWESSFN